MQQVINLNFCPPSIFYVASFSFHFRVQYKFESFILVFWKKQFLSKYTNFLQMVLKIVKGKKKQRRRKEKQKQIIRMAHDVLGHDFDHGWLFYGLVH